MLNRNIEKNNEAYSQGRAFEKGSGCLTDLNNKGWDLLAEEVSFPIAVIKEKQLLNNAKWMQEFSDRASVKLAPHGKTSMAPELFKMQLEQGCWGMSLATVPQVVNTFEHGVNRIILANQLVGAYHMKLIADLLLTTDIEFYCFVDSIENIHALGKYFSGVNVSLNILIEIGVLQGRCGWRDTQNIDPLLDAIEQYPHLHLCGISFYEGVIHGNDAAEKIVTFINSICTMVGRLYSENRFDIKDIIVTGAGSAWYDIVSRELSSNKDTLGISYIPIIRPGCYLIHDKGIYQAAQNEIISRSQLACDISGELISNLELWAYVHSVPEPGLAVIGLGKRDVAFDAGLPIPEYIYRPGNKKPQAIEGGSEVINIMDQHCMMTFGSKTSLQPGDIVIFATSHPCLTMDKWRRIGLIDSNFVVKKTIETFF
ncbi:alanine racemase [Paraglaciecola arctica]|uniref:Alanine racemase domain protein n=1 Tax=Paraglaciecola arctica BSs20135 TaxID=493475 RepID=K6YNM4_9ALTE|nr:alanine racemase [Paraglaciecola arctica]GAC18243.1 alanine racemase domain protein [Paraglaciecola arctica BSs20135]